MWRKFFSRRFICGLISVALPIVNAKYALKIPAETIIAGIGGLVAFIAGESVIDAKRK